MLLALTVQRTITDFLLVPYVNCINVFTIIKLYLSSLIKVSLKPLSNNRGEFIGARLH